ncbi:MAG: SurA N-terminal domain-containing protein [candidate division NC10 bacterium]|nr:SurA N-terminal domain-containing protein [candidate division NC10 bacterium]
MRFIRPAQKFSFALLLASVSALASPSMQTTSGGQEAQAPIKRLATIGREVITDRDLAARLRKMPGSKQVEAVTPEGKKALLNRLIYRRLLSHEAERLGLDRDPEVALELQLARENVLFNAYLQREVTDRVRVTKEEAKEYFEAHQEDFPEQTFKGSKKAVTAALTAEKAGPLARKRMKELWEREQVKVDEAQLAKLDLASTIRKDRPSAVEILQMLEKRGKLPEELRNILKQGTILEGPPPKP